MIQKEIASQLICKTFSIPTDSNVSIGKDEKSKEVFLQLLEARIREMLDTDFATLCNIMYRIDIAEDDFNKAFTFSPVESIATNLANLVWERELDKVAYRLKYR